ncbi:MAG: hypothetical protein K2M69_01790 [Muribaculaceae bacterium]|nr:hypothetical protein [Muribaculaceae bacterium]
MGRRYKKISGLPIPGFDRAVRKSFSTAFDIIVGTGCMIGTSIYNNIKQSGYSSYSGFKQHRTLSSKHLVSKPKPKKSVYKGEIEELELAIKNKVATIVQCERLASIYDKVGDYFRERYVRIMALERFLRDCRMEEIFYEIVDAFNNPCKTPPHSISNDKEINKEYRRLIRNAELAKRKSYKF